MSDVSLSFRIWTGKKDPFFEAIILNSNRYEYYFANKAVEYCRKVLNSPWPEAERVIIGSSMAAYNYSRHILKKPWEEGEKVISESCDASYLYSRFVLNDRFKLGEKTISNWDRTAYLYAKNVLKDRFEIAEKSLAKGAHAALYAARVMKKRWKKAEENILQRSQVNELNDYVEILRGKDRVDVYNKIMAIGLSFNDPNAYSWKVPVAKRWLETFGENFVREK
jgi:hypothetical protein